jgi:hypothetical protein
MEGKVPLADVREGRVTLRDLMKLNALLDSQLAAAERQDEQRNK